MGLTHTLVKLRNLSSANGTYEADFLVDIGATDSLVPGSELRRIGVQPVGRSAYETARTSHDFTEALDWARRLDKMGDKNGERLLKMVYMQMGWGAHRDYVQAYAWLSEGIAGGAEYLVQWRKMLAEKMTPEQVAAAKKLAGE